MSFLRRLPWVSLSLLLLTYATYGWLISKANPPLLVWLLAITAAILLVGGLTSPFSKVADYTFFLFKSNLRSFTTTVLAALLFFAMLAWFRVFLDTLVIIAASILARIDFQTSAFNQGQTFWILSTLSLIGLGLGAIAQRLFVLSVHLH
ncbi:MULTISPECIES: hypothetical protein [Nostocales]|uniref:Uncharacterized protein n=3 Tax=Nostocales TaxID=1161 RepID=A0A0C1MWT1_9CYAN|nr:hypothetical protein [Tolypothrix bouteillei]KAF3889872.1 hypothetical protein DA73_0400033695 [Tolypothrix bouteillei VB521301]